MSGSSLEMEEQARQLSDAELTEIAYLNDTPPALKARAELARRVSLLNEEMRTNSGNAVYWARVAGYAASIACVIGVIAIIISVVLAPR